METADRYIAVITGTLFLVGIVLGIYKLRQQAKINSRWMK